MSLKVIPAIDLRGGRCVRLIQGQSHRETVYSREPVEVAKGFEEAGAERLHVVDLDGAFSGRPGNLEIIRAITSAVAMPVEVGGGIRDMEAIDRILDAGAAYVILGTAACENPRLVEEACRRYPGKIIAGIDARDGRAAVRGWVADTEMDALDLARRMVDLGVEQIIFTDIARDGMLTGPNIPALERMTGAGAKIIASGGVAALEDIQAIAELTELGVMGVIIGKALYSGRFTLPAAIEAARAVARSS
ncbi:MAG: 1-(5-phosphoribosyl)-5-[(5-phosphoribosylamino)methylideneamino]imidazole-4-carboxamide isomerase [Firmicutes bacterium]|nr:1-(5-phosphoribosyl)-5-[(5-phosphoribosylamino)methylideneamino]imidazole-4-carboxamide isomerase [Bacillota bacterium]